MFSLPSPSTHKTSPRRKNTTKHGMCHGCECKNSENEAKKKENSQHFVCGRSEILVVDVVGLLPSVDNETNSVIFISRRLLLARSRRFYDASLKDYSNIEPGWELQEAREMLRIHYSRSHQTWIMSSNSGVNRAACTISLERPACHLHLLSSRASTHNEDLKIQ